MNYLLNTKIGQMIFAVMDVPPWVWGSSLRSSHVPVSPTRRGRECRQGLVKNSKGLVRSRSCE